MRKRIVYWLCEDLGPEQREKAAALQAKGYEIKFFNTYSTLTEELKSRRASIIIIGDETGEAQLQEFIIDLSIRPELQGIRFILSIGRFRPKIVRIAACCSFRDIIPIDLPTNRWLMRFIYATAGAGMEFEKPQPQVAINEISAMYMPARVVWITQDEIHLETRVRPEIGSVLSLGGELPRSLGVNALSLKTSKRSKTNLAYRFSDGLTAKWSVPERSREEALNRLTAIRPDHFGHRHKIFVAIQSPKVRERLIEQLEPLDFMLSIALKRNSMIHEPFYFGPDLILLEEKLLTEDYFKRYVEMAKKISSAIPVLIIGQPDTARKLQEIDPGRNVYATLNVDKSINDKIHKILRDSQMPDVVANKDALYLDPKSLLSMGEIRFSARLRQLHPMTATIDLPFAVGPYALGRIDSPLVKKIVKRAPVVKVTNSYKRADEISSPFKFRVETLMSDTFKTETDMLTKGLIQFMQSELTEKMSFIKTVDKEKPEEIVQLKPASVKKSTVNNNPINDLAINTVTFKFNEEQKAVDLPEKVAETAITADLEEERMTQLITQDVLQTQSDPMRDAIRPQPVHIEARDYSYRKPARVRDEMPGKWGEIIGSRRNLNFLIMLGFLSFAIAVFYFTKVYIERDWGKDQGKVFVDSLRGYAPRAFDRGLPKKKEEYPPPPASD